MKRKLNEIPQELKRILTAVERKNIVIPLITLDEEGFPNVSLLSPYQVFLFKNIVGISVNQGTRTYENLIKRGKATLLFVIPPKAYSIKGVVKHISEGIFELKISIIEEDYSEKAPITSQLLFDENKVKEEYLREFERLRLTLHNLYS